MEVISWTQSELEEKFPECKRLEEVVGAIEKSAESDGKVVCRVIVNDMKFNEEDEKKFAQTLIKEVHKLSVELESTDRLVAETLISLQQGLSAIRDKSVQAADLIRENPMGKAQIEFSSVMEETNFLMEALTALKPRMHESKQALEKWSAAEAKSRAMIRELLQAFERQDFILVSDVLEYEMYNLMEAWLEVIDSCEFS